MKIANDVLEILSACRTDGNVVFLPPTQLERKLYERVNKVLEAIGGKWNRKAKGHVFGDDPAARLDDAIVTGEVDKPADFGFFETPTQLAEKVVRLASIRRHQRVLEPSAGLGRIALEVLKAEPEIMTLSAVELQMQNAKKLRERLPPGNCEVFEQDFLAFKGCDYDRVVMNPPFARGQDVQHVTRAFNMLRPNGKLVSIMSAGVEFRQDARTTAFRDLVKKSGGTITKLPEGSFRESGTMVNTVIVTMERV